MSTYLNPRVIGYVALMLVAALAANLAVQHWGPSSTPWVALALIGCDLTARDGLHLSLSGLARWFAIGIAIALGSLLTYLVNQGAGPIALASVVAFAGSLTIDTIAFAATARFDAHRRVVISGALAAAADTLIFFGIAFGWGAVPFSLMAFQWSMKVTGTALWGLFLVRGEAAELYEPTSEAEADAVLPRHT